MEIVSTSSKQTQDLAEQLAKKIKAGAVIALVGDLGAGKTTFTRFIVKALGSDSRVQSPTFVVARKYIVHTGTASVQANNIHKIYHLDLYRLKFESEVRDLDLAQFFEDETAITIIEWPEIVKESLPENSIKISFEYIDDSKRKIYVENIN